MTTKNFVIALLIAVAGVARAQSGSHAVWHRLGEPRPLALDSLDCTKRAQQLAGETQGNLHRREFVSCMHDHDWYEALRYAGRDSCAAVSVAWVKPPTALSRVVLDSLRRGLEIQIADRFFPPNAVRDLEARIAFGPEAGGGYSMGDTRIVTVSTAKHMSKDEQSWAAEGPVMMALSTTLSSILDARGNGVDISGIVVLRARCLRDLSLTDHP